jgi:hypothetical protein
MHETISVLLKGSFAVFELNKQKGPLDTFSDL